MYLNVDRVSIEGTAVGGKLVEIERFKRQHVEILDGIASLRTMAHAGIEQNAARLASQVQSLGTLVKVHLAVEDRILYPAVRNSQDETLSNLAASYQEDMKGIAHAFIGFVRRWSAANAIKSDAEGFRRDANVVLRRVYERMQRENREFYPAIEAM